MKFTVRRPLVTHDNSIKIENCALDDINVQNYAILTIDGSTSNSGLAIMRECDGALMYCMSAKRDSSGETPVQYKVRLKRQITELIRKNKFIKQIYYEEPVVGNITAVANLYMLKPMVEEIIIENEPEFDYIKHYEVPNMRWKKELLAPDKVPMGSENQKKAVRKKILESLPFLEDVTQDEIDAIGIGYAVAQRILKGQSVETLQSKKPRRAFKFHSIFVGADTDDDMLMEFSDLYNGPESILQNGISLIEINGRQSFTKAIYEEMGDEDKLLIIKFSTKHHGNVILEYKIGSLAAQYDYIYAFVWRVARKRS